MFGSRLELVGREEEGRAARTYLRRLADVYLQLEPPRPSPHDWVGRAARTLRDLEQAPAATTLRDGDLFVLPYPQYDYPDSMVQLALASTLKAYGGEPATFADRLLPGVHRFYDAEIGTLRRYLPGVDDSKDYDAVDSWYLYHPMMSLARLALAGGADSRELLMRCVDYGVRAARHFNYRWPVFYRIQDFQVLTQQADARRPGETDAGGLYAYVVMQLHELTGEARFLDEAEAALTAASGEGLALMYQTNLVGWGAAACIRLWRATGQESWIDQCHYWLANLLHHCDLREHEEGAAAHYPTFMAAKCMYSSDYFAALEDHECFSALGEVLAIGGDAIDPAARLLAEAYRTHAADRSWYHYPNALPASVVAKRQESGIIDPALSFPIEDLYPDGRAPGQVGQEIYGAGSAFVFAAAQSAS